MPRIYASTGTISSPNMGKGAVDGVGCTIKRAVFSAVKTGHVHISTAYKDYATCDQELCKNTTFLYKDSNENLIRCGKMSSQYLARNRFTVFESSVGKVCVSCYST